MDLLVMQPIKRVVVSVAGIRGVLRLRRVLHEGLVAIFVRRSAWSKDMTGEQCARTDHQGKAERCFAEREISEHERSSRQNDEPAAYPPTSHNPSSLLCAQAGRP